jgi:uncharacterized protein YndB with AHSA1/START domain
MSAVIESDRARVWRALTDPVERAAWDERIVSRVEAPSNTPLFDTGIRWRYRLGSVQLVMHEVTGEVQPLERLEVSLRMGSLRLEQIFTLRSESGRPTTTHLGMKVRARNSVPVMGEVIDRFEVRTIAAEHIDSTLGSIQKWCAEHPKPARETRAPTTLGR